MEVRTAHWCGLPLDATPSAFDFRPYGENPHSYHMSPTKSSLLILIRYFISNGMRISNDDIGVVHWLPRMRAFRHRCFRSPFCFALPMLLYVSFVVWISIAMFYSCLMVFTKWKFASIVSSVLDDSVMRVSVLSESLPEIKFLLYYMASFIPPYDPLYPGIPFYRSARWAIAFSLG